MKQETLHAWCKRATRKIKYPPDRRQVYNELLAHLEEKCEDLLELGYPDEEVADLAIKAMGDTEEVAPLLGAIHKPLWGFVYSFAKWLAVAAVFFAVASVWFGWRLGAFGKTAWSESTALTELADGDSRRIYYAEPGTSIQCDGFTFTLTKVAVWNPGHEGALTAYEGEKAPTLHFQITVAEPLMAKYGSNAVYWMQAEDNIGNRYVSDYEREEWLEPQVRVNSETYGTFLRRYEMSLLNFISDGVEWVDLVYARDGRSFSIRIDLTEVGL